MFYLVNRYYTIGINRVIDKVPVNAHAFVDLKMTKITNAYPEVPSISLAEFEDIIFKKCKETYRTFTYNADDKQVIKDGKLAWCGFTHDFVISYCIHKGIKNIGLIGVADFIDGAHYSHPNIYFNYSKTLRELSEEFIEDVFHKGVNIFTCNPNSRLKIPYISIDELLK